MDSERVKEILDIFHKTGCLFHTRDLFGSVSKGEFFILEKLYDLESAAESPFLGVTVTQLAKELYLSKATMSKLLRIVERKNYIIRTPDDRDRRIVYIRLSEEGRILLLASRERVESVMGSLLDSLGDSDSRELIRIMRRLLTAAESNILFQNKK